MYSIKNNKISLTRGDTFRAKVKIYNKSGDEYTPVSGDSIYFAIKEDYEDKEYLVFKEVPIETMVLKIEPEDTKDLDFGNYVWDMQLNHSNGDVDTFITKASIRITEEVV